MSRAVVYLNGQFIEESEALIPITDRALLFGDGVFTTIKIAEGVPLFFDDHHLKLTQEAKRFGIIPPKISRSDLLTLIEKNGCLEGVAKILLTGGDEPIKALPQRRGRLIMLVGPLPPVKKELKLKAIQMPLFPGKMIAYLPRLFLKEAARPADDALLINERGEIVETAFGNLFWDYEGELFTPDPERLPLYFGVTMMRMAKGKRLNYVSMPLAQLPIEAKLFRANALGIIPVSSVIDSNALEGRAYSSGSSSL